MLTYRATALALKAFSLNTATKTAYRKIGNVIGGKRRAGGVQSHYLQRADQNLAFIEEHGGIRDGMKVLELGTGWVHWEALFLRAFYEVEATVFDVWDNRQFDGFLTHVHALRAALPTLTDRGAERRARAEALLDRVARTNSFDEAYAILGFTYLLSPDGSLDALGDDSLDLVFSSDVMEHIPDESLPVLAASLARVVRPGGLVAQQIVPSDHLCIYAKKAHRKAYLQYSDSEWARWFENDVQYQNRWQQCDFRELFKRAGFEIVSEAIIDRADTSGLRIAPRWSGYPREELDATVTRMLVRVLA
jgi:SAM-dependent methyltransferase